MSELVKIVGGTVSIISEPKAGAVIGEVVPSMFLPLIVTAPGHSYGAVNFQKTSIGLS